ncbi:MAG: MFS transporter [Candidatus Omnitrophica bacterium]|nr:MFS transporter [Candidatus Omnitrophota bacterium]
MDAAAKKKSLDISLYKGAFGVLTTGFTQEFFTPFILFLGATARHVGILNGAINLFSSIIQLFSAEIAEKFKSRKKMVSVFIIVQLAALSVIVALTIAGRMHYWIFITLAVAFVAAGTFFQPAWASFLCDLVGESRRGEYFGWRSRNLGLLGVAGMITGGLILHHMEQKNLLYGFCLLFGLGLFARSLSFLSLQRMQEPPLTYNKEDVFSFLQFFLRLKKSNFAKFVIFVALMNFSVNLAAPYFAVLMLKDLKFNYLVYSMVTMVAPLALYLNIPRWGQHADKVGNLKVIKLTSRLLGLIPLFWIVNQSLFYLVGVEMFAGFLWAGFNLSSANFIYDAASPQKRTRCIAYFNVVNGSALACGALLGGWLVRYLPPLSGYKILSLFFISACLRLGVSWFLPQILKEVRNVDHVKSVDLFFSMIRLRPILSSDRNGLRNAQT